MTTEKANRILKDAWLRLDIPAAITDNFEIFNLISDSAGVLFYQFRSGKDQYFLWLKGLNPHRNRAAFGMVLNGDEIETLTDDQAQALLQYAVNVFAEQSTAFDEGGTLPEPIRIELKAGAVV